jgi:hypothetical protein
VLCILFISASNDAVQWVQTTLHAQLRKEVGSKPESTNKSQGGLAKACSEGRVTLLASKLITFMQLHAVSVLMHFTRCMMQHTDCISLRHGHLFGLWMAVNACHWQAALIELQGHGRAADLLLAAGCIMWHNADMYFMACNAAKVLTYLVPLKLLKLALLLAMCYQSKLM